MMDSRINNFIQQVIDNIVAEEKFKTRISKDLYSHISQACESEDIDAVLNKMGTPIEIAKEFMDTIYEDKSEVIEKLIQEKTRTETLLKDCYEYKSKLHIFGLPFIHIKLSRRNMPRIKCKPALAKGIIAIGNVAIGVISLGGISLGGISFGAVSAGLLAFGGAAVGGVAFGGFALGLLAIGGIAAGLCATGGIAIGKIAIGGIAKGTVAIGGRAIGDYIISGTAETNYSLMNVSKAEIYNLIKSAYPNLNDKIINIFTNFAFNDMRG